MAATKRPVSVATPDRCWRKFRATRSALRIERTGPCTSSTGLPAGAGPPEGMRIAVRSRASTRAKTSAAVSTPATMASCLATIRARPTCPSGTNQAAVMSPAPISSARAMAMGSCEVACILRTGRARRLGKPSSRGRMSPASRAARPGRCRGSGCPPRPNRLSTGGRSSGSTGSARRSPRR